MEVPEVREVVSSSYARLQVPVVSVVLPQCGRVALTQACVCSLQAVTSVSVEIILVVDGGSEDEYRQTLSFFRRSVEVPWRIVWVARTSGYARAVNAGLQWVRAKEAVLIANNDLLFKEDAIGVCLKWLRKGWKYRVGAVTCRLVSPDGTIQHNVQHFPVWWKVLYEQLRMHRWIGAFPILYGPYFTYDRVALPDWVWGTFFLVHRRVLSGLGGLPVAPVRMYMEDWLWCWWMRRCGWEILFTPETEVIHWMGGTTGWDAGERRRWLERIEAYVLWRCWSVGQVVWRRGLVGAGRSALGFRELGRAGSSP